MSINFKTEIEQVLDKNKLGSIIVQIMTNINNFNYLVWRQGGWKTVLGAFAALFISLTATDWLFSNRMFNLDRQLIIEATIVITAHILLILLGLYLVFSIIAILFFKQNLTK